MSNIPKTWRDVLHGCWAYYNTGGEDGKHYVLAGVPMCDDCLDSPRDRDCWIVWNGEKP